MFPCYLQDDGKAYNSSMDDIGGRVKRLRQQVGITGVQMAKYALGDDAPDGELRGYADRLSKLERGDTGHTNPSLDRLELLAAGMRLSLPDFFTGLEGLGPAQSRRQTDSDLPDPAVARRTTRSPEEYTKRGRQDRTVPLDAPSLLAAGDALVEAGGRLIAAASGIKVGKDARQANHVRGAKPAKDARRAANR